MGKGKRNCGRLSVFKGREAKLNKAIFHVLALHSPLTIYEICKEIRAQKSLKKTKYTNVNRRVRTLEKSGYLEKVGKRKTRADFQATLYSLTAKAYLAILLSQIDLDKFILEAEEVAIITELAALVFSFKTFG